MKKLCGQMGLTKVKFIDIEHRCKHILNNQVVAKKFRRDTLWSSIQSYEPRDTEEFQGVFEIENVLKEMQEDDDVDGFIEAVMS